MSDEGDDDLMQSAFNTSRNEGDIISPSTTSTITEPPLFPTTAQSESQRSNRVTSAAAATTLVDLTSETSLLDPTSSASNSDDDKMTVDEVAEKTVQYCRKNNINDPVEILRCLQLYMVTGRALEVEFAHVEQSGETNFIMVDRQNLLQTALDEISSLEDFRRTLEVQFYDEVMFLVLLGLFLAEHSGPL